MEVFAEALHGGNEWIFDAEDRRAACNDAKAKRHDRIHAATNAITVPTADIAALTGKERPSTQARVLARLGIPHRCRPDGSLIVLRCHLDTATPARAIVRTSEPQLVL